MSESLDIINFISDLLEDSKFFLIEAKKQPSTNLIRKRYLRASILFAWAGFEGWINKSCFDFSENLQNLSLHERAFLIEKRVETRKGEFHISNSDKYESTEEKIEFLLTTIAKKSLDKSTKYWQDFKEIKHYRDSLIHPKKGRTFKVNDDIAEKTLITLVHFLDLLSRRLYKKRFNI
jgi:hypothetical protein